MSIGVDFIEPGILFNLLNQEFKYPCISDPVYMLLLDARLRKNYEESHIITAKCVKLNDKNQFIIPNDYELSCKTHVIVYDLDTVEISFESKAFRCAREMWRNGSRNPVKLLEGGYKLFSSIYPFLRTRKIIYLPRELDLFETYPCEVIRGQLYLGRRAHANMAFIQRDLKIDRHVNCSGCPSILYPQIGRNIITLNIRTNVDMTFYTKIQTICNFIDLDYNTGGAVLVYSEYGSNRSAAVVVAYVIYVRMCSYEEALALVQGYCPKVCICRKLADQLKIWAKDIHTNPFAIEYQNRLKDIKPSETLMRGSTINVCREVSSSACIMDVVRLREHEETEEELEMEEIDVEHFKSFTFGEEEDAEEDSWISFIEEEVPQTGIKEGKSTSKDKMKEVMLQYGEEEVSESSPAKYGKEIYTIDQLEYETEEIEEDIEEHLDEDIEEQIEEEGNEMEEMDKKAGATGDIQEDIEKTIQ